MERVLDKGAQVVARKNISSAAPATFCRRAADTTEWMLADGRFVRLCNRTQTPGRPLMMPGCLWQKRHDDGVKVVIRIIVPLVEYWKTSKLPGVVSCSARTETDNATWPMEKHEEKRARKLLVRPTFATNSTSSLCFFDN